MKFSCPQHALRWAYETSNRPIVRVASLTDERQKGEGARELTAHDRHAQAAQILSLAERVLDPLQMAYIRIQFGREASGFDTLCNHLAAALGTGTHPRRVIEKIIRSYCGEKIGIREIRKTMACGMLKAAAYRNQAYDAMDVIHYRTMDILREEMGKKGLMRTYGESYKMTVPGLSSIPPAA